MPLMFEFLEECLMVHEAKGSQYAPRFLLVSEHINLALHYFACGVV